MSRNWSDTRSIERFLRNVGPSPVQEFANNLVDRLAGRAPALARVTRRSFWSWLFFLGAAASFFAMVASAIQLRMLGAIGFLVLMTASWLIGDLLAEG